MASNASCTVTTTAAQIIPAAIGFPRLYLKLTNVSPAGSGSIWVSHLTATPAPNVAGSIELPPGVSLEFNGPQDQNGRHYVPQEAYAAVASSGTLQLTAEYA
ncbi:hypothetical protein [Lichenicoccus roseus]|uniref:Uncharacterized protein n=1 Tax=Lichenicoccus roseus TaxID=2683649 RepID=A0A5R9J5G2_9PROT|nr:hypothetical protein [Lichenicoccus roseus]TLU70586.1 hypothetical protein FE263_21105 [Lichenicoccus roseus]